MAAEEIAAAIEVPANTDMGDFAYPCFKLAKVLRKAPPLIAQEIGEKLEKPDFIADVKIVGAYINFFMDKHFYTKKVLETVLTEKENYGKSDMGAGKTIVIDYSSSQYRKAFPCRPPAFYCYRQRAVPDSQPAGLQMRRR